MSNQIYLGKSDSQKILVYRNHFLEKEKLFLQLTLQKNLCYYLELVVPRQAGSPQGKTSELLQHLSDQATVTHIVKLKLALKH